MIAGVHCCAFQSLCSKVTDTTWKTLKCLKKGIMVTEDTIRQQYI